MTVSTHTLLDRFLRYVRIDTQADERSTSYPSTPGQLVLGKLLRDELLAMGLTDAVQNEHGLVFATVPGNVPGAPTIAFNSHVDTFPETSGKNVDPQVIRDYPGGDIVLPKDRSKVIRVADSPELAALVGKTLITTDGTTLLGADDKAGVAEPDLGDERLEAAALGAAGAGETQILIDDVDALARPAEIDGTIDEAILELGALLMVLDLGNGRLAHVDEGALGTMERGRGRVRPDRGGQHDGSPRRGRAGGGAAASRGVGRPAAASRH